ncbi:hypothetical protein HCJ12_03630 [Listeria welshimeri]|nr:hypothetical protein [Listeria welshimeri]
MDLQAVAKKYFNAILKGTWNEYAEESIKYVVLDTSHSMVGKSLFFKGAGQFYSLVTSVETLFLVSEGYSIATINRYTLKNKTGKELQLDVSEFIKFNDKEKIEQMSIFFDSKAFGEFLKSNE